MMPGKTGLILLVPISKLNFIRGQYL